MCIVCVEWQKGNLTNEEALAALGEMIVTDSPEKVGHYFDVEEQILAKEKEDE